MIKSAETSRVLHTNNPLLSLGLSVVLSFSVVSVANGECVLSQVEGANDKYLYPSQTHYENRFAYVCGKGYCDNGTVLYVASDESAFIGPGAFSGKRELGTGYIYCLECKHGVDDKWIKKSTFDEEECRVEYDGEFVAWDDAIATGSHWGKTAGTKGIYKELCFKDNEKRGDYECNFETSERVYVFSHEFRPRMCFQGVWQEYLTCFDECKEKPTDWHEQIRNDSAYLFFKQSPPFEYTDGVNQACVWCEKGKWDKFACTCIETETETPPTTSPTTSKKTVEERCREYNGGAECSPERLECYKKGSATKWENGQCKCVDTNRTWEYKNNNGQCIANKTAKAANNTALCKTALGDLEIGKSFTDVDLENCKDTEKTETNTGAVASWEIICETGAKVVCKPYTCIDGYELDSEKDKCIMKDTAELDKAKEIEKAKRVVKEFFNTTQNNRNVWRNADGNFNTARLASDVTAGVVLGTVGGVVSGVVIKKKQVEKGFDALHCTVGGQTVADWGDTFRVGIVK